MPTSPLDTFVDGLYQSRLLTPAQWDELTQSLLPRYPQPHTLARALVARGWLTAFQIRRVGQGRGPDLLVGPYVLLDRIGQGQTGQVYLARHQHLRRSVALKVIRDELRNDPAAVARFHAEVARASQMSHPNLVHIYDAGQFGSQLVLVMEHVPGADLGRIVAQQGPLLASVASDYVCQAALGLQYAFEHGLVHGSVNPAHLLVAAPPAGRQPGNGTLKLLDLGLSALRPPTHAAGSDPTVFGPPSAGVVDYLAPERARDPAAADIRADIYSLGCVFFHLLTGQVPFPATSVADKLAWHQQAVPPRLAGLRADLTPALDAVVQRMLAKSPAERFQVPLEVVHALGRFPPATPTVALPAYVPPALPVHASSPETFVQARARVGGDPAADTTPDLSRALEDALDELDREARQQAALRRVHQTKRAPRSWTLPVLVGGLAAACLLFGLIVGLIFLFRH